MVDRQSPSDSGVSSRKDVSSYLPMTQKECVDLGWLPQRPEDHDPEIHGVDFVLVSGDAYVDHPSFANAVIGRLLEARGHRVAILSQPDWKSADPFRIFGAPRVAWLISAGNLDSHLNHYTAHKKPRSDDQYSPRGKSRSSSRWSDHRLFAEMPRSF